MQARHILLKTPLLVDPILELLEHGSDFAQLAREHSACPSAENDGDWGQLTQEALPTEILDALNEANVGEIIGPIKTRHGLHLIKLESV
ncbi:peptidylprolyl isomerase [Oceaniserpentilla sp. 4NH20-0058]|uniref:peptidylprolyl isomerase n=1 Tax=Oceaniserpentilla sp. 4NH20-0058 TaxID=3127660 RepID=UPI003103B330